MPLPNILTRLLDATARRQQQLAQLRDRRPSLEADYLTAIAADDDAAAAKARKALEKVDEDIAALAAALEAGAALQRGEQERAAAAALAARREAHDKDMQALIAHAVEFDELVNGQVAELWREIDRLFQKARVSAQAAGTDFLGVNGSRPDQVWRRVWMRFTQTAGRSFGDVSGMRASASIGSVADFFRVKDAAASPQQQK